MLRVRTVDGGFRRPHRGRVADPADPVDHGCTSTPTRCALRDAPPVRDASVSFAALEGTGRHYDDGAVRPRTEITGPCRGDALRVVDHAPTRTCSWSCASSIPTAPRSCCRARSIRTRRSGRDGCAPRIADSIPRSAPWRPWHTHDDRRAAHARRGRRARRRDLADVDRRARRATGSGSRPRDRLRVRGSVGGGRAESLQGMKMRGVGIYTHADPVHRPPTIYGGTTTLHATAPGSRRCSAAGDPARWQSVTNCFDVESNVSCLACVRSDWPSVADPDAVSDATAGDRGGAVRDRLRTRSSIGTQRDAGCGPRERPQAAAAIRSRSLVSLALFLAGCRGVHGRRDPRGGGRWRPAPPGRPPRSRTRACSSTRWAVSPSRSTRPAPSPAGGGGRPIIQVYEFLVARPVDRRRLRAGPRDRGPDAGERSRLRRRADYTFPIREGVTFHDGTDLTADDVKYSWDRVMTMDLPEGRASSSPTSSRRHASSTTSRSR